MSNKKKRKKKNKKKSINQMIEELNQPILPRVPIIEQTGGLHKDKKKEQDKKSCRGKVNTDE